MKQEKQEDIWLKEYELCQSSQQYFESLVWKTSAAMGIGAIGSFVTVAISDQAQNLLWPLSAVGLFIMSACWIWWGTALRLWNIEHATIERMRKIEKLLNMNQKGSIDARDRIGTPVFDPKFSRRGVIKYMRFFPSALSVAWSGYIFYLAWPSCSKMGFIIPAFFTVIGVLNFCGASRRVIKDRIRTCLPRLKKCPVCDHLNLRSDKECAACGNKIAKPLGGFFPPWRHV